MQLRLRTKLTLIMTGLVLLVVAVLSGVFVAQLLEQVLQQTDKRTHEIAHQVFVQAARALNDAAEEGRRPLSNDPPDIRDYVRQAFEQSENLQTELKAAKLDAPAISIFERRRHVVFMHQQAPVRRRDILALHAGDRWQRQSRLLVKLAQRID